MKQSTVNQMLENLFEATGTITAMPVLNQFTPSSRLFIGLDVDSSNPPLSGVINIDLWFPNEKLETVYPMKPGVRIKVSGYMEPHVVRMHSGERGVMIKYIATEFEILK